jgi:hypothetical protein
VKPPTKAVFPSELIETLSPWLAAPAAPDPINLLHFWSQVSPVRVNVHEAPEPTSSAVPPIIAVFPSALKATLLPWLAFPIAPEPTNLLPCCDHMSLLRVNTQAAPLLLSSALPPMIMVLPSALIDSFHPC